MVQNVWETIAENWKVVILLEKAALHGCSDKNSVENTRSGVLLY